MDVAPAHPGGAAGLNDGPGAWEAPRGLPLLVVPASLVAAVAVTATIGVAGAGEEARTTAGLIVGGLVVLLLAIVLWAAATRRRAARHRSRARTTAPSRDLLVGLAAAVGLAIVAAGLVMVAGIAIDESVRQRVEDVRPVLPEASWQIRCVGAIACWAWSCSRPLGEELLFRGLLLRGAMRWVAFPGRAAAITGALFAAAHLDCLG